MKKVFFATLLVLGTHLFASATTNPAVSEPVLKSFQNTFQSVTDVAWTELAGGYEARFTYNDIVTRVVYNKEGKALSTIRYYFEQQLPLNILTKVKSEYKDQKVFSVTEVTTGDEAEYHIVLEDGKNWTMVLADGNGSLNVQKRFVKA